MTPSDLKDFRERRERLYKRTNPRVRPFDFARDAWVMWGAYDLGSFPNLPKGLEQKQFFALVERFVSLKSSALVIEEDHKFFREKRGPVAFVTIDNYSEGWRVEPSFDFFFWATPRQRLAAAVSFFQMARYSKEIGVCVLRVAEKDAAFCKHLYKYDLLRPYGEIPNAGPLGKEYLFGVTGRRKAEQQREERQAA